MLERDARCASSLFGVGMHHDDEMRQWSSWLVAPKTRHAVSTRRKIYLFTKHNVAMWPAQQMAQALATYRASTDAAADGAVDEALRLLRPELSFAELKKQKARHAPRPLTWTKLAEFVGRTVGAELLRVDNVNGVRHAAAHASRLRKRLAQRDASHSGRVTTQTRGIVTLVSDVASALDQLASLDAESAGALTLDDGGRVVALYAKLVKLRDQFGGSLAYARRLLERAVRIVLASGAHGGVKSLYERTLAHWPATAADDGAVQSPLRSSASVVRFGRPLRLR